LKNESDTKGNKPNRDELIAEEALRKQAALIDLSPDGIMVKKLDDTITFWSQGAERLYGWTKEEAIGQKTRMLFKTTFPHSLENVVRQLRQVGKWSGELIHHAKDGHEIIVQSFWLAVIDKNGEVGEILESNVDITERKNAEEALRKQAALIDLSPDGIMVKKLDDTITFWSQGAEKLYGWTKEEAIGKKTLALFKTTFPDSLDNIVTQLKRVGKWSGELIHHAKNGREVPVQSFWLAVLDKKGEVSEILESNVDIAERKAAEEKLHAASLYSRSLIEASLDPLVTISPEGKITDVNEATELVTGFSRVQLIGSDFSNYFTEPEKARQGYQQVFTEGFVRDYPLAIRHKSGKITEVFYNATIYKNEIGKIQGVFAAARDVTERKHAEETIRAASLYSRSLIEASLDPLVTISAEGKITDVNKSTEEVTGCSREQLIGSDFSTYFTDPQEARKGYQQVFTEGFVRDYPLAIRHKTGKIIYVLYNATVYKNELGKIQGVFAAARDVTERRSVEQKLRVASLYSRSLIEASLDPLVTISPEGKITDVNEATELVTGFSRVQLIGSDFSNYFTEPEKARAGYRQVFTEGFVRDYPLAIRNRSGKVTDVLYNATVYRNEAGEIQGVFAAARDVTERKQGEGKLRAASLYSRSLIEASLDPLVTINAEGKITDVNQATESVTGFSRAQLIDSDFSNYFTKPDEARAGYQKVFTEGLVRDYPLAIRHKSGKVTDVLYNATVYRNEAGEIQGVFAAARDVTERKQAEEKLRAASLYSRSLIEASLDPLVTISANGKITDVNKSTEEVTGFSRDQLIGSDFSDYFTEPEKARAGYKHVFTEGFVRDYPLAIRHKNGRITDVLYNATVYQNETGKIEGIFAAARDITERKQSEMRIREQAELLDQAHDAITVRDLDNHILYWNKGAQRLYGWTAEEALGKKANEMFYKEETPASLEARTTVMEKGEWSGELRQITKKDVEITLDSHWTLMRDSEGKPKSIFAIQTDVSEKKRLEGQILRAQRMESIGTLAAGIAHDLNNVLTPIMMSLQLLRAEAANEESNRTLDVLEKSAKRGAELVKQVLMFARGVEGERQLITVKPLITEIERIIKETFPKNIDVEVKTSPDLAVISGDSTQLHQVIMNLCVNGRDAMPNGGRLTITADNAMVDEAYARIHMDAKIGRYVVIAVADNGIGIPADFRDKLFTPFFTTKERGKGTGLGLSTASAIVRSHGGFINWYSEIRKGSTFKVYIPAFISRTEKPEETTRLKFAQGQGELILIVDDEASICEITRTVLESNGYKVIVANDGAEAVALYSQNQSEIKVVLMDMAMPVMDGYAGIRALKRINPKVKIIAASGLTENGKLASIHGYVNTFIAKPYTSERLLKTIEDVLSA
jgi:PAS domain S-box-containing protein